MSQIIYNTTPIKLTDIGEILTLASNSIDISNNTNDSSLSSYGLIIKTLVERADYASESITFLDITGGGQSARNSIVVNAVNNLVMGAIKPSSIIDSLDVSGSSNQILSKNVNNNLEWINPKINAGGTYTTPSPIAITPNTNFFVAQQNITVNSNSKYLIIYVI